MEANDYEILKLHLEGYSFAKISSLLNVPEDEVRKTVLYHQTMIGMFNDKSMKPISQEAAEELTSLCKGMVSVNDALQGFHPHNGFLPLYENTSYTPKDGEVFAVLEGKKVVGLVKGEHQTIKNLLVETNRDILVSISLDGNLNEHVFPTSFKRITDDIFREVKILSFEPKDEKIYIRIDPIYWDKMLKIRRMFLTSLESLFGNIYEENEGLVNKSSTYPL